MNIIKKEIIYFLTAIMFFTRIPILVNLPYSEEIMNRSQKYYALVGLIVGVFNAGILWLSLQLFSIEVALVLMMGASVLLTGAFHEDGFTDVCDSFGGGYGKEKILTIMKDSRIGAYGGIGIILLFLLKIMALRELYNLSPNLIFFLVIIAHSVSRLLSGLMIYTHQYVSDIDKSKSKPMANKTLPWYNLFIGIICVFVPFLASGKFEYIWAILLAFMGKWYLGWYFKKHIGGYTGDCLGTVQQVTEVLFYLGGIIVWKFI